MLPSTGLDNPGPFLNPPPPTFSFSDVAIKVPALNRTDTHDATRAKIVNFPVAMGFHLKLLGACLDFHEATFDLGAVSLLLRPFTPKGTRKFQRKHLDSVSLIRVSVPSKTKYML